MQKMAHSDPTYPTVVVHCTGCPTNSDFFHFRLSQPLFEIASIFKKQMKRRYRPFRILEKKPQQIYDFISHGPAV